MIKPEYMSTEEFRIVRGIVDRALAEGYSVSVIDDAFGEGDRVVKHSCNASEVISALASTGSDLLVFRKDNNRVGFIALVYNGDETVVHDHSDNEDISALVA